MSDENKVIAAGLRDFLRDKGWNPTYGNGALIRRASELLEGETAPLSDDVKAVKKEIEGAFSFEDHCAMMDARHPEWRSAPASATSYTAIAAEFWDAAIASVKLAKNAELAPCQVCGFWREIGAAVDRRWAAEGAAPVTPKSVSSDALEAVARLRQELLITDAPDSPLARDIHTVCDALSSVSSPTGSSTEEEEGVGDKRGVI